MRRTRRSNRLYGLIGRIDFAGAPWFHLPSRRLRAAAPTLAMTLRATKSTSKSHSATKGGVKG
jgi:hypothetical protein